ncbi:phage portal protein [Roseibium litorale]|uniref:Phage portal protein n=1 Tax=Roseibium litorale TaxID=2803841 RepID=A0ABR9CTG8_9HYPH|nr:phage portal protein [Roseibium litorale]MBD8894033.1 phage portal protein [Roseibium litorale]
MGIFSRLFGKTEEKAPTTRIHTRLAVRRFKAGKSDRISGFPSSLNGQGIQEDVRSALRGLISHSRHVSQNNDYMKGFYGHVRRNVIGRKGVQIKPQSRYPNGDLDTGANRLIKEAWEDWGKRGNCTVCGKYTWKDVQRIAISSCPRDGNFLLRVYRGKQYGKYGFQVQILDFLQLDIDLMADLGGGSYILCGIEFNALDRPIAYHLFKTNPGRFGFRGERVRIPASDIVHLYNPYDLSTSVVGVPWAHTALRRLGLMGEFEEAAAANARWGASKMGFFTKRADIEEEGPVTGRAEGSDGDGDTITEPEIDEIEAGLLETLPEGWDFKAFDPAYPSGEMGPFIKAMLRGSAAGLGVAYTSLANDLEGINYSGLRAGLGEERDEWTVLQDWFSDHFCGPVAASWLDMALLTGAINLPFAKRDKFAAISWTARGWRSVNPKDDATANSLDMQNLLKSPQEICAERGRSLEEVLDDFKEAADLAQGRGIDFWSALAGGAAAMIAASKLDSKED